MCGHSYYDIEPEPQTVSETPKAPTLKMYAVKLKGDRSLTFMQDYSIKEVRAFLKSIRATPLKVTRATKAQLARKAAKDRKAGLAAQQG